MDTFSIPQDIKPVAIAISAATSSVHIKWSDHVSEFTFDWLHSHTSLSGETAAHKPPLLWNKAILARASSPSPPAVEYAAILAKHPPSLKQFYNNIDQFGFSFINNVPPNPQDSELLCNAIGNIRHTHYGGFWDFTTDLAMADTAYSDIEIPSHTDGTYWEYTPYLQLFHLLFHNGTGGETTLVDAFHCAQVMKQQYPAQYELLSNLKVQCHSLGDIYLHQSKPVFIHNDTNELVQVSWNNSDRSSNYKLSVDQQIQFYDAIRKWHSIISATENIFHHKLVPGQALIFNNWRLLHARIGITTGERRMCGAYFDKEDFHSNLAIQNATSVSSLFNSL